MCFLEFQRGAACECQQCWWRLLSHDVSPTGRMCVSSGTKPLYHILPRFVSGVFLHWELGCRIHVWRGKASPACLCVGGVYYTAGWIHSFLHFSFLRVTFLRRLPSLLRGAVGSLLTVFLSRCGLELRSIPFLIQTCGLEEQLNRPFHSCRPLRRVPWEVLWVPEGYAPFSRGVMRSDNSDACGFQLGAIV